VIEGSEMCLLFVDTPYFQRRGVYLNPNVRTVYNEDEIGWARQNWPSYPTLAWGYWFSRKDPLVRLFSTDAQQSAARLYAVWRKKLALLAPTSVHDPDEAMCTEAKGYQVLNQHGWHRIW
jgi:hypothetical protein